MIPKILKVWLKIKKADPENFKMDTSFDFSFNLAKNAAVLLKNAAAFEKKAKTPAFLAFQLFFFAFTVMFFEGLKIKKANPYN